MQPTSAPVMKAPIAVKTATVPAAPVMAAVKEAPPPNKPVQVAPQPAHEKTVRPLQPIQPTPSVGTAKQVLREPPVAVQAFMKSYQQLPPLQKAADKPQTEAVQQQVPNTFLPELVKPLKIIGTACNTYILVEYDDHLLLIDQQGVHERLLFDRMMKLLDTQQCAQELLVPIIVPVTRREQQLLESHRDVLQAIGLSVETFGDTEVSIRSIPMILGQPQAGSLLREIIDQLEGERGVISLEKRRAGILALACKKSVKSGEKLNEADIRELVVRMVEKKITPASPRGTPLIVALSHADVDRRFRRIQ